MKKTVFFIGSGSTVSLNMPTSFDHINIFESIKDFKEDENFTHLRILFKVIKELLGKNYNINDVFNLIDSNLLLGSGLYSKNYFIAPDDLLKTKKELIIYIIDWFLKKIKERDNKKYLQLVDFYYQLSKKELNNKIHYKGEKESLEFILASYSTINLNYDLYSIMPFMEAHAKLNKENNFVFCEDHNPYLKIFTDYNCEFAVGKDNKNLWFPINESSAALLNRETHHTNRRIILSRAFFPHGLMNLYRCPCCSRHILYMGDLTLKSVEEHLSNSKSDICFCPYCHSQIKKDNIDVLMQSNFKTRNSFLEEIRLKMQIELQNADRIIFIGYSCPIDDIDMHSFFKSISNNKEIYVVLYDDYYKNDFGFKAPSYFSNLRFDHQQEKDRFVEIFRNGSIKMNFQGFFDAMKDILKLFD